MDLFTIIALPVVGLVIVPLIVMAARRGHRRSATRPLARHRSADGAHHAGMFGGFSGGDGGGGGCDGGGGGGCGGGSC
jgi:hypothetical protein